MKYYKRPDGEVWAFEDDGSQDELITDDMTAMTAQEIEAHLNPAPPAPSVPKQVTMRQARLALLKAGLLDSVSGAIDALPSPDKEAAQIEWEYSQTVERDRPFVAILAAAIGLDDEALDTLFLTAQTL